MGITVLTAHLPVIPSALVVNVTKQQGIAHMIVPMAFEVIIAMSDVMPHVQMVPATDTLGLV
jgi:hypothetical protein